jgi:hypothetical protein
VLIVGLGAACILLVAALLFFAQPGPPRIVSITPSDGASNVDPNLTEIRVIFDRPMMNHSWSMCGGGPNFPPGAGSIHYDAKHTTWTAPVALKPGMTYEFGLNSQSYQNFKSAKGIPLKPVWVTFTTAQ